MYVAGGEIATTDDSSIVHHILIGGVLMVSVERNKEESNKNLIYY